MTRIRSVTQWVAFISVCVGAGQRASMSVLTQNPHKGSEGEISRETGSGGGKERPWEDRESQSTKEGRREQSAWDSCPETDTISRKRQWEDWSRALKRWVSIPWFCVGFAPKQRDSLTGANTNGNECYPLCHIWLPIKTKEKRLNLILKFIVYSLRNIKAIKTVIPKILKT